MSKSGARYINVLYMFRRWCLDVLNHTVANKTHNKVINKKIDDKREHFCDVVKVFDEMLLPRNKTNLYHQVLFSLFMNLIFLRTNFETKNHVCIKKIDDELSFVYYSVIKQNKKKISIIIALI